MIETAPAAFSLDRMIPICCGHVGYASTSSLAWLREGDDMAEEIGDGGRTVADKLTAEYRDDVRRVFSGKSADPVFNGTIDHASVVIEEAFKAAKSDVRILSKRLDADCWARPAIIEAAQDFLARQGTHIHILVESFGAGGCTHQNEFLAAVKAAGDGRVEIRVVPPEIVQRYTYNFLVVDDVAYRFEEDRNEHVAVVAGGPSNSGRTERLLNIFSAIGSHAKAPSLKAA